MDKLQNPFTLENQDAYLRWRDQKLAHYPTSIDELIVEIKNPMALSKNEKNKLLELCRKTNMALYHSGVTETGKDVPRGLASQLGLHRLDPNLLADDDGITSLEIMPGKSGRGYIPYSDKRLLWHTDGYYNDPSHRIRAILMHCVRPAKSGGQNSYFDHEMAYIYLREENPQLIEPLMEPDVLTIPENTETDSVSRPAQSGPVFDADSKQNSLFMRYTARTRSIEWKNTSQVKTSVNALNSLLDSDCKYIFHHTLTAGQGIICNNILHNRTGFVNGSEDSEKRLIYRARYYDRVN